MTTADIFAQGMCTWEHMQLIYHITGFEMFDNSFCSYIYIYVVTFSPMQRKLFCNTGGHRPVTYANIHKTTWLHQ